MRISTKGRYGLAAMVCLAEKRGGHVTVLDVAGRLGVSKIYLEQVFALLKTAGLIQSMKGAGGGYTLASAPSDITAADVLRATEPALFENTDTSTGGKADYLEKALQESVWKPLYEAAAETLSDITLSALLEKTKKAQDYMFYI